MNWTDLIWILIGIVGGWWLRSSRSAAIAAAQPATDLAHANGQDHANSAAQASHQPEANPQLESLQQQLQQIELAYRMAIEMSQFRSGFLARTSHELRSPLNSLIGMQQLILTDLCDSPEEEREFIQQAYQSALKMVEALDRLIDVSKAAYGTAALEIQPVAIAPLLESVYLLTQMQAQNRNLRFQVVAPDPNLYGLADPHRLQQVLVTLVDRTIANLSEGTLTLSAQAEPAAGKLALQFDTRCPSDCWSEPTQWLQTEPDPTAKIPSAGLNLLICQNLLELMHGQLEVVSIGDPNNSGTTQTQLQCIIPIVIPEE